MCILQKGGANMNGKEIGKRLVALRGSKTQKEVCKATGIGQSALSMYETGRRIPRDEVKVKLAVYYGTTVLEIFFAAKLHEL